MSNEERIRAWREQRRAGVLPTDPQATALSATFNKSVELVSNPRVSVLAILHIVIGGLAAFPGADLGQRRDIYARLTDGVQAGIKERELDEALADYWARRVQTVVRAVEADVRQDVAVLAEGYAPAGLAEADAKLLARYRSQSQRARLEKQREARRRATREDVAHEIELPPADIADLERLRTMLLRLHETQRPAGSGAVPRVLTIVPLFFLRLVVIQADSRIALLWSFVGPVIMMTVISSVYFINGLHFVLGMDVPTFTLVGAVTWIMFRMIVFRSSESYFGGRAFMHLEPVTPLIMALTNSAFYFVIYVFVMSVLVLAGHALGLISLPVNIVGVLACMFGVGVIAAAFGLVFAGISTRWEFFMRFAPPIERALQLFSSVFFVSEQFPAMLKPFILWWPMSHGLQLLRSAWFTQYKSEDASVSYFIICVILFFAVGLMADRLSRPNVQPM